MSSQFLVPISVSNLTTGTRYCSPTNLQEWSLDGTQGSMPWTAPGLFRNLKMTLPTAPGVGASRTFTLDINGVASGLTVTFTDTDIQKQITGVDVAVLDGDSIRIRHTNTGVPTGVNNIRMSMEFIPTVDGTQCFGSMCVAAVSTAAPSYNGLFAGDSQWNASATEVWISVAPTVGTVTGGRFTLSSATGAGVSRTLTIYKNGVKQDGTGGTVDTRITATNASSASGSFSLPVAAGDRLYVEHTVSGAPASSRVMYGYRFVATNTLECVLSGNSSGNLLSSAQNFAPAGPASLTGSATESDRQMLGPVTTVEVTKAYWAISAVPGGVTTRTLTVRRNGGSTPGNTVASTITSAAQTGDDTTHTLRVTGTDLWNVQTTVSGAPTAALGAWGLVLVAYIRKVPNVGGLSKLAAQAAIITADLVPVVVYEPSDTVPIDEVISQDPPAGTDVEPGSDVTIIVSSGPAAGGSGAGARYANRYRSGWNY